MFHPVIRSDIQLLAGLDKTTAAELLLAPPEQFFMISQGGCLTISDEVDDGQAREILRPRVVFPSFFRHGITPWSATEHCFFTASRPEHISL